MARAEQTIGKYRILEEIASGACGRVYRGEDTSKHNMPIAIKLMHSAHLRSPQDHSSFLQEARLITLLKHPSIVSVLDVGIEANFPYLVMAYAPNGSLYDHLKQREPHPLPIKVALNILFQIGAALQYAHQQNVIHRDLKPANILFDTNGDALLADFSVATMLETSMKYGTATGTPYYMAPEQFHGTISKEADQYALGCIAYQMMTGRLPFDAPDFFALGYKHMTNNPLPPTQLNLLVPPSVESAILRAMAKQRTDRFPDVASFLAALGTQRQHASVASPLPSAKSRQQRLPPPPATVWPPFVEFSPLHSPLPPLQPSPYSTQPPPFDIHYDDNEDTLKIPRRSVDPEAPHRNDRANGEVVAFVATPAQEQESVNAADPLEQNLPTMLSATSIRWDELALADTPLDAQASLPTPFPEHTSSPTFPIFTPQYFMQYFPPFTSQYFRNRRVLSVSAAILLLFVLLTGGLLYTASRIDRAATTFFSMGTLTANISITPAHVRLDQTYTLSAVTGTPVASQQQVSARSLSSSSTLQSRTFPATGQGTTPATEAQGQVTFSSNASRPISISANTKINAGNDLIAYPDTSFVLSPHSSVTQSAHISTTGPDGNIPAGSINDRCCSGRVTAYNSSAFTGGANATTYTAIAQSDYNNAVAAINQMQAVEITSTQASISSQIRTNEKLAGSILCTPLVSYNHHIGDHASSITGSVSVTCTVEVYDQQGATAMAAHLLQLQAASTLHAPLAPTGTITTVVKQVQVQAGGTIALQVEASSIAAYQFNNAQKQTLAALIAGKTRQQALSILQKQTGIASVIITLSNGNTLPTTTNDITIVVTG
jgi:serine/threonine protein kinase